MILRRIWAAILCGVVGVGLGGCAGAPPISVHPDDPDPLNGLVPEWAVVIVDLNLETSTSMINSSTLILPSDPTREPFAIYVDIGKEFQLQRLSVPAPIGYSADLKFPDAMKLPIPKRGIYYYGRVDQVGSNVSLDYAVNAAVIRRMQAKYPFLFRALQPANF